ncbi:MAG: NADH-quinone oxidoreductase subunit C [Acidiferrobacterales bacterium]
MSSRLQTVSVCALKEFGDGIITTTETHGELTLEVAKDKIVDVCTFLRDDADCKFEILIDLSGVDYLAWRKEARGKKREGPRFAVVYHLLSIQHNSRVRVRTFADDDTFIVNSVVSIWNSANWYEREAFDLFGIIFEGHPDLRRLLTDYGFIGHAFRKDFPISGNVEMRYDERKRRVVYEPVSIEPRTLSRRIIREEGFGG